MFEKKSTSAPTNLKQRRKIKLHFHPSVQRRKADRQAERRGRQDR
jgi:hypothetical protein